MPCGVLGAFLCFSDRVVYPAYSAAPNIFRMTPSDDQVFAGALMWVFGTFVYLVPAVIITVKLLSPETWGHMKRDCLEGTLLGIPPEGRGMRIEGNHTHERPEFGTVPWHPRAHPDKPHRRPSV